LHINDLKIGLQHFILQWLRFQTSLLQKGKNNLDFLGCFLLVDVTFAPHLKGVLADFSKG
jgi:hypothetical protein